MADANGQILRTLPRWLDGQLTWSNFTIDGTTDAIAFFFQAETTDPITGLWFKYGLRTGTPVAHTFGLEGVDASGLPDTADIGGGSPTAAAFTPPPDTSWDSVGQWITLTNAYTPSAIGQELYAVIRPTGTPDGANNSSFARSLSNFAAGWQRPNTVGYNAGSPIKYNAPPAFAYRTSSKRFLYPFLNNYTTASSATAGHRVLCKFTAAAGWGSTYKIRSVSGHFGYSSTARNPKIVLLDSGGSVLQSHTLDTDQMPTTNNAPQKVTFDGSLATLSYGTQYYIGVEVGSSAAAVSMRGVTVGSADDRTAFPFGVNACLTTFDGSTYTDDTTVVPALEMELEDITEPAGGGGGGGLLVGGGMTGGFHRT